MRTKYIFIILIFFAMIFLAACGNFSEGRVINNVYLEGEKVKGTNKDALAQKIKSIAIKKNQKPKNAVLNESNWEIIEKESQGVKINEEKTLEAILNAKDNVNIKYSFETLNSEITAKHLKDNIKEIGKFTTIILDQKDSRINNIEIASECLNNTKVLPGEVFSFNDFLGKRTKEKGYEKAPIIINTEKGAKKAYGLGGGICQISSTLYKAVKSADMKIIERHSHSKKIGYLPLGEDASVSFGYYDLKFENNKNIPIMIKVVIDNNELTVKILGNYNKT